MLHAISSAGMYGAEAVVLTLCRAMERHTPGSVALAVFQNTSQPNLALHEAALAAGIASHLVLARGRIDLSTPAALRNIVCETGASVLHTHGYKADVYGYAAVRGTATGLVSTCHNWCDTDLFTRMYGWLDRRALRHFHAVAAVSEDVKLRLVRSGVPTPSIQVVRSGIDVAPFQGSSREVRKPLTVGYAGRLSPEKGIDLFVEVARRVLRDAPETRFLIAGDGPERAATEQALQQYHLEDNVQLLGRSDNMPHFYRQCDALLSSSRTEGLPVGLMEAMASGLPVIATAVGDVPTLIEDGVTGLLVDSTDVPAMATATLRVLENAGLRQQLGRAGSQKISAEFSDKQMVLTYLELYRQALTKVVPHGSAAA